MSDNGIRRTRDFGRQVAPAKDLSTELIEDLLKISSHVLIKKLATNDRQWAIWDDIKEKWKSNQAGPLLPARTRTENFFPPLISDPVKPHNSSVSVEVLWPKIGKLYKSNFIWYSGKSDAEHHFTINPRSEFAEISPASYLLIFKPKNLGESYNALTIDAEDDDLVEYISDVFKFDINFTFDIFDTRYVDTRPKLTGLQYFVIDLLNKLDQGPYAFNAFVSGLTRRSAVDIASTALKQWTLETGNKNLSPYDLDRPGDVLFELTRVREFALYKQDEVRTYGAQVVRALIGDGRVVDRTSIISSLIEKFDIFYEIFKRAKQARVSRAGGSFEIHMMSALKSGGIPHAAQNIFDGSKPDFVLPSGYIYRDPVLRRDLALVLTLKTTLRERWKQVVSESTNCPIYLATLDESVPSRTLDKLKAKDITLVVPEKFKTSEFSEYQAHTNVISFRTFFDELLENRYDQWHAKGIDCFGIVGN